MTPAPVVPVTETKAAQQRAAHCNQRLARYQQVCALHAGGLSQRAIACQLGYSIHVIRKFIQADPFPERATRRPVVSKLDPFLPYLRQQLAAGHDNARQLWRELCDQQGYTGSRSLVSRWVAHHRHLCPAPPANAPKPRRRGKPPVASSESAAYRPRILSARQAAWLLFRSAKQLDEDQEQCRQRLCQYSPTLQTIYTLVQEFIGMVRQRTSDTFDDWLTRSEATASAITHIHQPFDTDYVVTNEIAQDNVAGVQDVCGFRWKVEQFHRETKQVTGIESCQCRKARIVRNHIGYAILVWVRLKQVAHESQRTIYRVKHDLLDDYLRQQLKSPTIQMRLA